MLPLNESQGTLAVMSAQKPKNKQKLIKNEHVKMLFEKIINS